MDTCGKISQIIGPVVDVEFEEGHLPRLHNALRSPIQPVMEALQHLGNNTALRGYVHYRWSG